MTERRSTVGLPTLTWLLKKPLPPLLHLLPLWKSLPPKKRR